MTHTKDPFVCYFCSRQFWLWDVMARHVRSHWRDVPRRVRN